MKLTQAMKKWLSENKNIKSDATDEEFRAAATKAIADGSLSPAMFAKLCEDESSSNVTDRFKALMEGVMEKALAPFNERLAILEGSKASEEETDEEEEADEEEADDDGEDSSKQIDSMIKAALKRHGLGVEDEDDDDENEEPTKVSSGDIVKMFAGIDRQSATQKSWSNSRVKSAVDQFSDTKSALHYSSDCKHVHLRGQRVTSGKDGHELDNLSIRDKAIAGAWFKMAVNRACNVAGKSVPRSYALTDLDKQLVMFAVTECKFTGLIGYSERYDEGKFNINNRKLSDYEQKALLDDSTSGGLEAAPIVFDDAVITTPLLNGELFPLVSLINLPRGRRVEGWAIGNPSITSGTAEGTDISLFNTSAFISAFDTTIYNAVGAMELGLDFEEDAPNNVLDIVVERYGQQFLTWLDDKIANGNGTAEPQGIFTATPGTTVTSDNGNTGPATLSDYEGLLFGLQKQYRTQADRDRTVFVSNDVAYRRSRAMKVDPASTSTDERRLLGMDHESYITLGHPHKIQHSIANTKIAFTNLRYYRMYRRLGLNVRIERAGKDLALNNTELVVVRARFGGRIELSGALAATTNAQT